MSPVNEEINICNSSPVQAAAEFKSCPCCGYIWKSREAFLSDAGLKMNGYQVDFEKLEEGLFMFTHMTKKCGSTLVIPATEFLDLYKGEKYEDRKTLSAECPRYCVDQKQLSRCSALCECAFVREVVHIVNSRLTSASK